MLLFDEFPKTQAVVKIDTLGGGTADARVWEYAKINDLTLGTKDKDFVDYWKRFEPPAKVIKLDTGNCRVAHIENMLKINRREIVGFISGSNSCFIQFGGVLVSSVIGFGRC